MNKLRWLGILTLLLAPLLAQDAQPIRVNELSPSVFRAAGDSNHDTQIVGDTLQVVWVGRDRFAFPFFAEIDLKEEKVTRRMKLTEKRGRGKGLRMNPAIGHYKGRTWTAWLEEIRRQQRSNFMLNLLEIPPQGEEADAQAQGEQEEPQSGSPDSDPRQVFDLGRLLGPVTFHETAKGFFALTHSQDNDLYFRLRLFVLGPDQKWVQVDSVSHIEGLKPVLVEQHERLWLYFLRQGGGILRSSSQDGRQWSEPQEVGEGLATSIQAVAVNEEVAVAWSLSDQETVQVRLSRCSQASCSPPEEIFRKAGRLGRIVLSASPAKHELLLLCSYWDHQHQSQVIEALAEAQGFEGLRLTPDAEYVSATRVPFLYNGADSAIAAWDQTAGREASKKEGGMIAVAEYDYGESRWKSSVATYLAGDVEFFTTAPLIAGQGDALWASFVVYRGSEVKFGYRQMPRAASTGDLYLLRVELDQWEARGAEQAGKNY